MSHQCPASMCPLIAKDGSPWTGDKAAPCPEDDRKCGWWTMACTGGQLHQVVDLAAEGRPLPVLGPNPPASYHADPAKLGRTFDCPKAEKCQWQNQSNPLLCPPRYALAKGFDPRIVLF